jgi:phosphatidate cytidylyltransferase
MRERVIYGLALAVPIIGIIVAGGPWFIAGVSLVMGIAMIEFVHLVARQGHRASGGMMLLWLILFMLHQSFPGWPIFEPGIAVLLLLTMFWTMARYRQGTANAFTGFAMTVAGAFYIGWLGSHFVGLRLLEDGMFWTLTVVISVMLTDTGAYLIGRWIGRTPFVPDISPKKTWEGYLGGIACALVGTPAFVLLWLSLGAGPSITPLRGVIIGLLSSTISPLGDLAMSMLKRYVGAKDASNLIPGHGGLLDRADAMLVAGAINFYFLILFALI